MIYGLGPVCKVKNGFTGLNGLKIKAMGFDIVMTSSLSVKTMFYKIHYLILPYGLSIRLMERSGKAFSRGCFICGQFATVVSITSQRSYCAA